MLTNITRRNRYRPFLVYSLFLPDSPCDIFLSKNRVTSFSKGNFPFIRQYLPGTFVMLRLKWSPQDPSLTVPP